MIIGFKNTTKTVDKNLVLKSTFKTLTLLCSSIQNNYIINSA